MLPRVDSMTQLNLLKYFRASLLLPQVALPSPDGPLSHEVLSTAISAANKEVEEVMSNNSITKKLARDWQVNALSPHA